MYLLKLTTTRLEVAGDEVWLVENDNNFTKRTIYKVSYDP